MSIILVLSVFIIILRSRDFFRDGIPLGYDPGLYKEMFIHYYELGNNRNFSTLPHRIQSMYEPGLGMLGAIFQHLTTPFHDIRLTWGWLAAGLLLPLSSYTLGKRINKETGILSALLVGLSFIQYAVFRRSYRKQGIGISLVLIVISLWSQRKIWHSVPLLIFIGISNRASLLRILLIAIIWRIRIAFIRKFKDKTSALVSLFVLFTISGFIMLPILWNFIGPQVLSIIKPFIQTIDIPNYHESFQESGTFFTTKEYLKTARYTFIGGITGLSMLLWRYFKTGHTVKFLISVSSIIMIIWVFGQLFFFQRMIGYLDVVMCICSAFALTYLPGMWKKGIIGLFLIINSITTLFRRRVIHPPIISKEEFTSIQSFGRFTTSNDIILCPGIRYSPWIQGWTSGEVLAPGLFDLNRWGNVSQGRNSKRYNKSAEIKCANLQSNYPELSGKTIYMWIGSKQGQENFSGHCFQIITGDDALHYHWYKVDL